MLPKNETMLESNVEDIKDSIGILLLYVIIWVLTEVIKIVYYIYKDHCPPKVLEVVEDIQHTLGSSNQIEKEDIENKEILEDNEELAFINQTFRTSTGRIHNPPKRYENSI